MTGGQLTGGHLTGNIIVDGSSEEIVNKFCHLKDMSVDGDADAAVTARIRSG